MGSFVSRFSNRFGGKTDRKLIINGLDAAGKTTILYKLKLGEIVTTIPTIGFNVETVTYKSYDFTTWDVGGRGGLRGIHRIYFQDCDSYIFVIDSNDHDRFDDARDQLTRALNDLADWKTHSRVIPVLIFFNKQDLPNCAPTSELVTRLKQDLKEVVTSHPLTFVFQFQGCCATTGDGLYEGLDWVSRALENPSLMNPINPPKDITKETASTTTTTIPPPSDSPTKPTVVAA